MAKTVHSYRKYTFPEKIQLCRIVIIALSNVIFKHFYLLLKNSKIKYIKNSVIKKNLGGGLRFFKK